MALKTHSISGSAADHIKSRCWTWTGGSGETRPRGLRMLIAVQHDELVFRRWRPGNSRPRAPLVGAPPCAVASERTVAAEVFFSPPSRSWEEKRGLDAESVSVVPAIDPHGPGPGSHKLTTGAPCLVGSPPKWARHKPGPCAEEHNPWLVRSPAGKSVHLLAPYGGAKRLESRPTTIVPAGSQPTTLTSSTQGKPEHPRWRSNDIGARRKPSRR